jgi:hypothetical protein
MQAADAERATSRTGFITLAIGVALAIAPEAMCRLLRVGEHPASIRVIGLADLALVPGLLYGRPRWVWMTVRAATSAVVASYCLHLLRRQGSMGAKVGAVAMAAATIADSNVARTLWINREPATQ